MANPSGKPSWADLQTTDLGAATKFYTQLFGWTAEVQPEPEALGYTLFRVGGKQVAGAGPIQAEGTPPMWTTYVATDDANAVTAKVEAAGGKVLSPPFDVLDFGRMAVFMDQAGAVFAVWQAGTHPGGEVFDVPGAFSWAELTTRDPQGSKEFYGHVFGWTGEDRPGVLSEGMYTTFSLNGQPAAGMIEMAGPMFPPDEPPHWVNYFNVVDCDASAAKVEQMGGKVVVPPTDIPPGRFAVVGDPQGAMFCIIKADPNFTP
ncbi:MAG TPA: glyoxalase [Micromonosporaceae bacterium]|nr:glyoxalase [Micromonosporaceae bacterium]HCU51265.1 glyoxalase [Micromonosporaceae bacterium]